MVLRHGTASGHGKVVEILANVMVLLSRLTRSVSDGWREKPPFPATEYRAY